MTVDILLQQRLEEYRPNFVDKILDFIESSLEKGKNIIFNLVSKVLLAFVSLFVIGITLLALGIFIPLAMATVCMYPFLFLGLWWLFTRC